MNRSYIIAFWSPYSIIRPHFCLDFFIPFLRRYGDIQCMDFQSRRDERTIRLLRQADLVVIGLPASDFYFRDYFCHRYQPFRKVCYALTDYFPALEEHTRMLCHRYRIPPGQLLKIPCYTQFLDKAPEKKEQPPFHFSQQNNSDNSLLRYSYSLLLYHRAEPCYVREVSPAMRKKTGRDKSQPRNRNTGSQKLLPKTTAPSKPAQNKARFENFRESLSGSESPAPKKYTARNTQTSRNKNFSFPESRIRSICPVDPRTTFLFESFIRELSEAGHHLLLALDESLAYSQSDPFKMELPPALKHLLTQPELANTAYFK